MLSFQTIIKREKNIKNVVKWLGKNGNVSFIVRMKMVGDIE